MTHHIFTKSGELFLIMEQVPAPPPDSFKASHRYEEALEVYYQAISRLKDSAIRIGNNYSEVLDMIAPTTSDEEIIDEKLYSIECEAEMMRDCKRCGVIPDGSCRYEKPCDFNMFPKNKVVAILKPSRQAPQGDELWDKANDEYEASIDQMTATAGYHTHIIQWLRSRFQITRR